MNTPNPALKPLFYSNPVPVDANKHQNLALRAGLNLSFAAKAHAVPVNVIEFPQLCHTCPIVFSPDAAATPVAVLGLRDGENLFVTSQGNWTELGGYMPSYIRRYPFLFASITGTDQLTLCVDEIPAIVEQGGTMRLFEADGKPSALTNNALEFCKSFHAATMQTREFTTALEASGILVAREADIPLPNGQKVRFGGFRMIDEAKFAALPDATINEWRKKGWMAAVYAALFSGPQWTKLARMYAERQDVQAA